MTRAFLFILLIVMIVCSNCLFNQSAYAGMQVVPGAPEGFEQMDRPRPSAVTLLYGGDVLGVFAVHLTPGQIAFDKPQDIIAAIPAVLTPAKLAALLAQPLPAHGELVCGEKRREGCGLLTPENIGVIFDENRLQAELFINTSELKSGIDAAQRYLPLPERQWASVDAINGAVNGTNAAAPTYAVTNEAIMSFGEAKLDTQTTASNQGLRFDTAAASVERQGWDATGGLFRSRAMQLLSDRDIAGVSLATSMHTVLDQNKNEGNDILLYLPRRSFVSIFREGRLYSSRAYEAGNQHIDTSDLPDGAYEITLRIQEPDGDSREERRFFVKAPQLPPPDLPTYYLQAGMIRKPAGTDATLPQLTSDPILRAGTIRRLTDDFGVALGALGVKDRAAFEPGLFWVGPGLQVNTALLASSRGDYGVQASLMQTLEKISTSLDARKLWMSDSPLPGFDDMARDITQGTASIAYAVTADASIGLRASYAQQSGSVTTASAGPYADWRIWQNGEDSLEFTADVARTGRQYQGSSLLHFSRRLGNYGVTTVAGGNYGGDTGGPAGSARIWHDDPTPGNALLVGAGFSGDSRTRVASSDADWRNTVGQLRGSVQDSEGQGGSTVGYGGNFAFNVAQREDEVHVGGDQTDSSALIIEASGDAAPAAMKIFVNGIPRGTVAVGSRQVIYLSPFHSYTVRLAPQQNGLLTYDANERKVTLYPGNVAKLAWVVDTFYVVLAKIATPDGKPLADAVLQDNPAQVQTDARGRLQAELAKPDHLSFAQDHGGTCTVTLPPLAPVNGILRYREVLICVPEVGG